MNRRLGRGKDGTVWETSRLSALKVFVRGDTFERELSVYRRLQERSIIRVAGHNVPQLLNADDADLAIEMSIVRPPFVLDFASAYLDGTGPVFPDDVMEDWLAQKTEEFGPDWPRVTTVLSALNRLGIQMTDVHPGNIAFR